MVLQDLERAVNLLKHERCAKGNLLSPVTPVEGYALVFIQYMQKKILLPRTML